MTTEHSDELRPVEQFRLLLIEQLRKELIGPNTHSKDSEEVLDESPKQRYSAGILFPLKSLNTENEDDDEESYNETKLSDDENLAEQVLKKKKNKKASALELQDGYDDTITMANTYLPSAMGISFLCDNNPNGIIVRAEAAVYKSSKHKEGEYELTSWKRVPLKIEEITISLMINENNISVINKKLRDDLHIKAVIRARENGSRLVTVSLYNSKIVSSEKPISASDCFYQVGFRVVTANNQNIFRPYQELETVSKDPEEISLRLLFRNRHSFGVGHGCAVNWSEVTKDRVNQLESDSFPTQKIPPVDPLEGEGDELSMIKLSGGLTGDEQDAVPTLLCALINDYQSWIDNLVDSLQDLPAAMKSTAERHIALCQRACDRMQIGINTLKKEEIALQAFCLANKAMLMQQYHSNRKTRSLNDEWVDLTENYEASESWMGRWRTFQLAFIIMNIGSITPDENGTYSEERDLVDLIWFPTGGGKTEAYLGLSAYTIFLRRLLNPDNSGCTVLMRYTLRLLTAQQFQRAAALISACESIRTKSIDILGNERISIGLWVGQSLSPNKRKDAIFSLNKLIRTPQSAENKFQLLKCPCCGTRLDDKDKYGYTIKARTPKSVLFVCPEKRCEFSSISNPLPVLVIDEDIYQNPPTLLIGTVDKFAMLAWNEDTSNIFGLNSEVSPPELIIQDELHLISGPLGTMVGLYEGIIDLLCTSRNKKPKIIGSTATIRRAEEQCKALYNRPTFQFPPSGLDISDSYFAVENKSASGRIYLGVFPTASPSFVTALVRTGAALLQGVKSIDLPEGADEKVRDPYWTLVEYFNSLRELGRALTLLQADIPEYLWTIVNRTNIPKEKRRHLNNIDELTSRKTAQEIPEILEELSYPYPFDENSKKRPLDAILATNMISVGVDVDRLGLMAVIGQPKSTSEYIQASSRVGRSKEAPGIVVSMYNPGKPRDRSHFEQFRTYHSSLYRYVEPTSVTPFSIPVMERALHSLLIIIGRHIGGWKEPQDVDFESNDAVKESINFIIKRCKDIDPEHLQILERSFNDLISHWTNLYPDKWGSFGASDDKFLPLMYPAGTQDVWNDESWSTPSSMRSVDSDCEADVITVYPD